MSKIDKVRLRAGSKVVVVDDTRVNVKLLKKMVSRSTSVPIATCYDGQAAIDLVDAASADSMLLMLMDWHMPGVCGLSATDAIRRMVRERGGPKIYICMVTADIEGLHMEMDRRLISYEGTVKKGELQTVERETADGTETSQSDASEGRDDGNSFTVVDIVAEKPVTFKSIQAILTWFQKQVDTNTGS